MQLDQMTGAGGTLTLSGKTFTINKPNFIDCGKVVAWVRQHIPCPYEQAAVRIAKINFLQQANPDLYKQRTEQYLLEAEETFRQREENLPLGLAIQEHGPTYLVWVATRPNHPEVTFEQLKELVDKESPDALLELTKRLVSLYAMQDPTQPAETPVAQDKIGTTSSMR